MSELKQQIEDAFRYRGHCTLTLASGSKVIGFVYNREFENPKLKQDQFVDVFLAGSGDSATFAISEIMSIELTGKDHAAGKSYEEWLAKQEKKKTA